MIRKKSSLGKDYENRVRGEKRVNLLQRFILQEAAKELIPQERVRVCLRYHQPNTTVVHVKRVKETKKAYYSGLMVCGSVWHCPVCASRISEQRRAELKSATLNWTGGLVLVTYTASHRLATPLHDILDTITSGIRSFKSGRAFQDIRAVYGWIGSVKALEVTHGANGWHPHVHELIFTNSVLEDEALDALEVKMKIHWRETLGRKGYLASTDRGLVISNRGSEIVDYVTKWGHEPSIDNPNFNSKWGVAEEISKAAVKKGRAGGRTPLQLLSDYVDGDDSAA